MPTRWPWLAASFLGALLFLAPEACAQEDRTVFAAGTPYETPYFTVESGREGETVLVVGALGLEHRGIRSYLERLASWELSAGRLVVVPGFPTPLEDRGEERLTRAFPEAAGELPSAPAATALWAFVRELAPDVVVQLATARVARSTDGTSYGNTLFATGSPEIVSAGDAMAEAASAFAPGADYRWIRMRNPALRSLVRSVSDSLGIDSVIFYPAGEMGEEAMAEQSDAVLGTLLVSRGLLPEGGGPREGGTAGGAAGIDHAALGEGKLRVAIFRADGVFGTGVARLTETLEAAGGIYVAVVDELDIRRGVLRQFDVAVFSGGSGSRQGNALEESGRHEVVEFVRGGGGYLGICAGAYLACVNFSWGLGILNARTRDSRWRRGQGPVELEITEAGNEVLAGPSDRFEVRYANGPVIEAAGVEGLPPFETWAWFRTELAENDTPEGIMVDSPAFAAGEFGAGRVVIYSPHPESHDELRPLVERTVRWLGVRREEE